MNRKALQWGLLAVALAALPVELALAQESRPMPYERFAREGYRIDKAEAEKLETHLAGHPDDLDMRARLLGFYFRAALKLAGPEATIAARRRHVLWLIEHHPASEAAGLPQATIDPAGHRLADKDGYGQAAKLWIEQAQRHGSDVAVLGNAARFFMLPDKARAEALLKQAQRAAPDDSRWPGQLGYLYALGVLGIDMINENGLPRSHNPAEAKGEFAGHARAELEKSRDVAMVGTAGMILSQYGVMVDGMFRRSERPLEVDYAPLVESLLTKAQELDPANDAVNRVWQQALTQFRMLRQQLDRTR
jgi:hypothetical protein